MDRLRLLLLAVSCEGISRPPSAMPRAARLASSTSPSDEPFSLGQGTRQPPRRQQREARGGGGRRQTARARRRHPRRAGAVPVLPERKTHCPWPNLSRVHQSPAYSRPPGKRQSGMGRAWRPLCVTSVTGILGKDPSAARPGSRLKNSPLGLTEYSSIQSAGPRGRCASDWKTETDVYRLRPENQGDLDSLRRPSPLVMVAFVAGCANGPDRMTTGSVNRGAASAPLDRMSSAELASAAERLGQAYTRDTTNKEAALRYSTVLQMTGRNEQALAVHAEAGH